MLLRFSCLAGVFLLGLALSCTHSEEADLARKDLVATAVSPSSFDSPWDTVMRQPDALRLPGDSARPTYEKVGGVHVGRDVGHELPINGDPR